MTTVAAAPVVSLTDNPPASKSIAEQPVSDSKEQEAPSTAVSTSASADPMEQDTECKTDQPTPSSESNVTELQESQLLAAGTKLLLSEKFDEAVPLLSDALELVQKKGTATNISAVPYYMTYGEGLLRLVQSSNDLFACPAPEQPDDENDNDEENDDIDNPPMILDATATPEPPSTSEPASEPASEESSVPSTDQKPELNGKEEASPSPSKDKDKDVVVNSKPAVDTSDDREIAWESLEYARTIMEDYLAIKANCADWQCVKKLAQCHAFLGEICIEDERNPAALTEFTKALQLQNSCPMGVVRCRERASNHYWACLAAQFSEKEEEALSHCEVALKELSERMCALMKEMECEMKEGAESMETQQVLDAAAQCLEGVSSEAKAKEGTAAKELSGLLSVAGDLVSKLEEVQSVIRVQKEQKANPQPKREPIDLLAAVDPLSALINGLVSKCGIDETEMAKIDTQIQSEEAKNGKEKEKQGVTSIGFGSASASVGDKGEEEEEVHEIMVVKKRRKRKLEETDMGKHAAADEATGKKMKLNTGSAMMVDSGKVEPEQAKAVEKV